MRGIGPLLSFGGHVAILFWGLVSFAPDPFESEVVEALPIEFVTISELTDLTKGVRRAPEVIDSEETVETPEAVSETVSEDPGPADTPTEVAQPTPTPEVAEKTVEATPPEPTPEPISTPPDPEPEPEETAQPEPEPDPVKVAEPEPTPPEPEPEKPVEVARAPDASALDDLIEETLENPEPVKNVNEVPAAAVPPSAPAPRLNPRPKVRTASTKPQDLINKKKPTTSAGGKPKKQASLGTKTGRQNARLTQTELDGLRDAIQRCWSLPPGYSAGREFQAKVKTRLTRSGEVEGRVNVVSVTGFSGGSSFLVKNAVKVAIQDCAPYKLPANKYAEWQDLEVTFYP